MLIRINQLKTFAIIWLFLISVLFFLPGSALPQEGLFGIPHFDKYVHAGFFAILLFLWRFYFDPAAGYSWLLFALAFCYGLGVEVIQHYFILYRSFDVGDVAADMVGAVLGLLCWSRRYIKK